MAEGGQYSGPKFGGLDIPHLETAQGVEGIGGSETRLEYQSLGHEAIEDLGDELTRDRGPAGRDHAQRRHIDCRRLVVGEARVDFDDIFSESITGAADLRVTATPVGSWSALYVERKDAGGFDLRSEAGDPNVEFDRVAVGRARGNEIQVAIRDTGRFMDPRTRKDWWQGR